MNEYLNKDMSDAVDMAKLTEANKDVLRQVLMIEKREKNNPAASSEIVDSDIVLITNNFRNNEKEQ